jgi:hypothetical protein
MALRPGEGPRADGFSMSMLVVGEDYLSVCALGTSIPTTISLHWRGGFPWVNFADVFGND